MKYFVLFIFLFASAYTNKDENCRKVSFIDFLKKNECEPSQVFALILARKGSKGILNKNLQKINKISLLGMTLQKIKLKSIFHEIWVSTDGKEIAEEAEKYGAKVHHRSPLLAKDDTPSIEAVKDFLKIHPEIQNIALFQCTSVFLKSEYILKGFELFHTADCVFTVTRSHKLRWSYDQTNSKLIPLNFNPNSRPRRQDWDGELLENGMFYFVKRQLVIENNTFQNERCQVVMVSEEDSLEIDTENDLKLARLLSKN